ncbi:hypothetical protein JY742_10160 [Clostridioides difficile]|nr:hypothetical protein [Clostridioides difficile]
MKYLKSVKYLKNIESLEGLKTKFKELAKIHHPDAGGDEEIMKEINNEYDYLFPIWKKKSNVTTTETANSTRSEFYTQHGWKGGNYNIYLSTKDIAKIIRQYVKEIYPTYKFSVTTTSFSGGSSISVSLMEAPSNIFNEGLEKDYIQINHYNISSDDRLNSIGKSVLNDVYSQLQSYNYDDSDAMIDYFDTNFYIDINVGKWDKAFKVVEKTSRIKNSYGTEKEKNQENNSKYEIIKDVHTKTNESLWIVKIKDTLSKDDFKEENKIMNNIGGYYSKFKHGFIFKEEPKQLL